MIRENVLSISNFISNLKLNGFDKEIRAAIIKNSILANKITTEVKEMIDAARNRYLTGIEDEVQLLDLYRNELKQASSAEEKESIANKIWTNCSKALKAEQELNDFVANLMKEGVVDQFVKIDQDKFIDQCVESDIDITPSIIQSLKGLFVENE